MFRLLSLIWDLFGSLFGTLPFPPQDPLERNVRDAKLFRLRQDQPSDIRGEFLAMGPFLYGCLSYGPIQRRGELPIAQRDAFPGREHVQENGQPSSYRDAFRAGFGLDR